MNEKYKQHIKLVLQKHNNRLQKYKDIIYTAPPKRSFEENKHKVNEDTTKRTRGKPTKNYTEEGIETLKQQKRDIAKRHYENNLEKRKLQKAEWTKNNKELINERARVYRAKKKLETELVLVDISGKSN